MEEITNIRFLSQNPPWKKLPISEFWVRILHGRNYQYQKFGLEFSMEEITNIRIWKKLIVFNFELEFSSDEIW
jgi:hypothetical protein